MFYDDHKTVLMNGWIICRFVEISEVSGDLTTHAFCVHVCWKRIASARLCTEYVFTEIYTAFS